MQEIWPATSSNYFTIKNWLFGAVKLTKNIIKTKKPIYNVYGIVLDKSGSWEYLVMNLLDIIWFF